LHETRAVCFLSDRRRRWCCRPLRAHPSPSSQVRAGACTGNTYSERAFVVFHENAATARRGRPPPLRSTNLADPARRARYPVEKERPLDSGVFLRFAACGAACGSAAHGVLIPIDVVKTRMQSEPKKYPDMVSTFGTLVKEEVRRCRVPSLVYFCLADRPHIAFWLVSSPSRNAGVLSLRVCLNGGLPNEVSPAGF